MLNEILSVSKYLRAFAELLEHLVSPSSISVYLKGNQDIQSTQWTQIKFDGIECDNYSEFHSDKYEFVPKSGGTYLIIAQAVFAVVNDADNIEMRISIGGHTVLHSCTRSASKGHESISASKAVELTTSNRVSMQVRNMSADDRIIGGDGETFLTITKLISKIDVIGV